MRAKEKRKFRIRDSLEKCQKIGFLLVSKKIIKRKINTNKLNSLALDI